MGSIVRQFHRLLERSSLSLAMSRNSTAAYTCTALVDVRLTISCAAVVLPACACLRYLGSRVLDPEVFSSLVRLQELRLEENAIRSINPAAPGAGGMGACLPQLRVLLLGSNRMMDAAECVRRLADIPLLAEVTVAGNPFARKQVRCNLRRNLEQHYGVSSSRGMRVAMSTLPHTSCRFGHSRSRWTCKLARRVQYTLPYHDGAALTNLSLLAEPSIWTCMSEPV